MQKNKFICNIGIVQTYLGKWGEKQSSVIPSPKFWQKEESGERNDGMEVRKKRISGCIWFDVNQIPNVKWM